MDPERWEQIKELFGQALELEPEDREAFLKKACPDDAIYQEVVSLLAADAGGDFLRPGSPIFAEPGPELTTGSLLKQRYRVEREIGRGGFASVFLATDQHLHNRRVVIKVPRDQDTADPWFEARFQDEIRTLAMIDHPGVIGLLDAGQTDGSLKYLVMQYAEGQTLRSLLGAGAMPLARIGGLITQLAQAVSAAHKLGIIHQDIKPENIMVQTFPNGGDRVRLIDFGIARLRSETTAPLVTRAVGSLSYMAPEQLLRRPAAASDIFSLGVITYELVTGTKPFAAESAVELYSCQESSAFRRPRELRPELPIRAEHAILKALAFSLEDRFPTAEALASEFTAGLGTAGPTSAETIPPQPVLPAAKDAYDVFVGYASLDGEFAADLIAELERRGARCFDGTRDLPAGVPVDDAVAERVSSSACFLLVPTETADKSVPVLQAVKLAVGYGKSVAVLRVESMQPTGILAFALARPAWVECPAVPARGDYDNLEVALRRLVPEFSGALPPKGRWTPAVPEPRDPLLTEVGARRIFGLPGSQFGVIAGGIVWALLTCLLSILGNASDITVRLAAPGSAPVRQIRFGYMYELNGAFTYLFFVPLYLYFSLRFVQKAQLALAALAGRDQLSVKNPQKGVRKSPLTVVGEANSKWLSPGLLSLVLIVTILLMVGTEYLPPHSDYKNVMFGYVQAPWIADYPVRCPGCTLEQLRLQTGRRIDALDGAGVEELKAYRIVEPFYPRKGTPVERICFILFIVSALSMQVAFGMLVLWIVLKVFFILSLLYRSVKPSSEFPLKLYLRFADSRKLFGLEPVHWILTRVVGLIGMSAVLQVLSWWSNFPKGSKRVLSQDLWTLGGWGQFFVTNYSVFLALALLVYLFSLNARTREAAADECRHLAKLAGTKRPSRGSNFDDLVHLIESQSIWASPLFTSLYILAPALYLTSLAAFSQVGIARSVGSVWDLFLRHILGME